MAKSSSCIKYKSKREVRRRSQERDQKAPTIARPNQNLDRIARYKRQIGSDGETKIDRDGKTIK